MLLGGGNAGGVGVGLISGRDPAHGGSMVEASLPSDQGTAERCSGD